MSGLTDRELPGFAAVAIADSTRPQTLQPSLLAELASAAERGGWSLAPPAPVSRVNPKSIPPRAAHMRAVGDLPTYGYEGSRKSISATSTARRPWEIAVAGLASRLTLDSTASGEVEHRHGPRGVAADTGRTRARRPRGFLADGDITGFAMHRA